MRSALTPTIVLFALLSATGLAADDAPFAGTWDCEVSTFTFTKDTYDPGDGPLKIRKVEKQDGNYILTLPDDYQIGLSAVTARSMEWISLASGDMFHCKKIKP